MEADRPQPGGRDISSARENSKLLKMIYWYKLFETDSPPRLGLEIQDRLSYVTTPAFAGGLFLGYRHGSKTAGFRFRAENAHRFPTTSPGWFQYHKTKNYVSIVAGVKDGFKLGGKLGAGALAFCLFEETVDYARHYERDFLSTVTAGLSFSGIYSLLGTSPVSCCIESHILTDYCLLARHDVYTAARTAKLGLKLSLTYGLLQDGLASIKGNYPAYVKFLMGLGGWKASNDDSV